MIVYEKHSFWWNIVNVYKFEMPYMFKVQMREKVVFFFNHDVMFLLLMRGQETIIKSTMSELELLFLIFLWKGSQQP